MPVTVYHGDCTEVLPTLAAGSVQCCVTSPPYFGLRAYPHAPTAWPEITFVPVAGLPALTVPAQSCHLGAEADPWAYVAHLVQVFRAVGRVLRADGTVWLNLGDSYAGSWGNYAPHGIHSTQRLQTTDGQRWSRRAYADTTRLPATATAITDEIKPKDLLLLPFRVAQALQADGWYVRTVIPWIKVNAMPESVRDRPVLGHEYLFLLARSPQYFYDLDAITVPATSDHGSGNGYQRAGRRSYQNANGTPRGGDRPYSPRPTRSRRTTDWWYDSLNGLFGTEDDLLALDVPIRSARQAHVAVYPDQLITPCILAGTPPQACDHCGAPWRRATTRARATYPQQADPTHTTGRRGWNRPRPGPSDQVVPAIPQPELAARLRQAANGREREMQERFGSKWDHWIRTDLAGARLPTAADAAALADLLKIEIPYDGHPGDWQPTCACPDNTGTGRSLVLDPFGGSGTTGAVAARLGRDTILIEAAAAYLPLIAQRTAARLVPRRPPPPPPRRGGHPAEEQTHDP